MILTEHHQQIENERLRDTLANAIAYLRLLPRVPDTSAKIAELERALIQPASIHELKEEEEWKIERFYPAGGALRVRFSAGELLFETDIALPAKARIAFPLTKAQLHQLIDALIVRRQNSL